MGEEQFEFKLNDLQIRVKYSISDFTPFAPTANMKLVYIIAYISFTPAPVYIVEMFIVYIITTVLLLLVLLLSFVDNLMI